MEIGKTLYVTDRKDWRTWLAKNHDKEKEIWLIYYRKSSGKPRIPYNDAVEEALCYGWIDSIFKNVDGEKFVQRFSPRTSKSVLSGMNRERIHKLIKEGKMTPKGLASVAHVFNPNKEKEKLIIAPDIQKFLKQNKETWKNFQKFPDIYKHIRIAWIEEVRDYPKLFSQRLNYFLKMTANNKRYGFIRE